MYKRLSVVFLVLALVFSLAFAGLAEEEKNLGASFDSASDILFYKSFPNYNEAPEVKKLVEEGKLPPIEDRLPKEPLVWSKAMMVDGTGLYGGVWRDTFAVPTEGWNWAAGQTQGWFGINQIIQETLVTTGPMWMMKKPDPLPHLATSWEWSEDGKSLTMHLMEGVKWSDGVEFTAEDVRFTYEDNVLDDAVNSWQSKGSWTYGEKVTELEVIDDYTIRWHFGEAFPVRVFYLMDYLDLSLSAAHVYKHFHPKYNEEASYEGFNNATPPEDLPAVVLGPYVPVAYKPDQQMILVRNPYYWQVDEDGNQLPYFDEIWFAEAEDGTVRTMNLLAGSGDRTNLENPQMYSMALKEAQKPDSHFKVQWEDFYIEYRLEMNLSAYASVNSDRDKALRGLFRDLKFRKAVSHAIDREGIANAAFPGPFTKASYGGYPSGSPYYNESMVVKYPYDPEKSRQLLTELGFEDTDGDEILNWPEDSPIAGKNLVIELILGGDQDAAVKAAEALQPLMRDVGISLRVRTIKPTVQSARVDSGDFEWTITRQDSTITPFMYPEDIGAMSDTSPAWHIAATEGQRDLMPFEEEIRDLLKSTATMTSPAERREALEKVLHLYTENLYTVGIYQARRGLGIAKRFKNIPDDTPTRLYQWFPTGTPIQTFWTPAEDQKKTQFQDLIPTPETYKKQDWYPNK